MGSHRRGDQDETGAEVFLTAFPDVSREQQYALWKEYGERILAGEDRGEVIRQLRFGFRHGKDTFNFFALLGLEYFTKTVAEEMSGK